VFKFPGRGCGAIIWQGFCRVWERILKITKKRVFCSKKLFFAQKQAKCAKKWLRPVIKGVGIEIVEVRRFKRAMERWGGPFLKKLFTEDELEYCLAKRSPEVHLAARFAAKISFFKAMGRSMPYKDIGVVRDKSGMPSIKVNHVKGGPLRPGLTITHTRDVAMAVVVVESGS